VEGLGAYYAREDGNIVTHDGKVLTVYQDGTVLVKPDYGPTRRIPAHRLVAWAFVPNPYEYNFVRFKDGNKKNRTPENLEWILSVKENTERKTDKALQVRYLQRKGKRVAEIAEELGITTAYVYRLMKKEIE